MGSARASVESGVFPIESSFDPAAWRESNPRQPSHCAGLRHAQERSSEGSSRNSKRTPPLVTQRRRFKAGKGIRTLDIQLGKLTLYQLSYARNGRVAL